MNRLELSVVVAGHQVSGLIDECLAALAAQEGAVRMEVIVAVSGQDDTEDTVRRFLPDAHVLRFDAPTALPFLRAHGICRCTGDVIALLDAFSVPAPDWASQLLAAHREVPHGAIGGAVEPYRGGWRSLGPWAVFLNEYDTFLPPIAPGAVSILPGCNLSYKKAALGDVQRFLESGFWKTFVNEEIARSGSPLWLAPAAKVALNKPIPFRSFLASRVDHGRCFAAMRIENSRWPERCARAVTAPVLPLVFLARQLRRSIAKRPAWVPLLLTLPLQFLLFGSWSWGELLGYSFGPAGSAERLTY